MFNQRSLGPPQDFDVSLVGSGFCVSMMEAVILSSSFEHVDIVMYKVRKKGVNCNLLITREI